MKVKENEYIINNKPLFKKLLDELLKEFDYASVLAVDATGKSYAASRNGISISADSRMSVQRGFTVKVYFDGCYAEYSGNAISEEGIKDIIATIKDELLILSKDRSKSSYDLPDDDPIVFDKSTEYEIDPEEMGDEAIINKLKKMSV